MLITETEAGSALVQAVFGTLPAVLGSHPGHPSLEMDQSKERILESAISKRRFLGTVKVSAVYFLIKGDEVVYIGASTNVHKRVATHAESRDWMWSHATFQACPPGLLAAIERKYLLRFRPRYNPPETYEYFRAGHRAWGKGDKGITP